MHSLGPADDIRRTLALPRGEMRARKGARLLTLPELSSAAGPPFILATRPCVGVLHKADLELVLELAGCTLAFLT